LTSESRKYKTISDKKGEDGSRTKGENPAMTRRTFQQGYVSNPTRTRNGTAFRLRYRVPASGGKWKYRSETLCGFAGKKAARAVLEERIKNITKIESTDMTLRVFADTFWKQYLDRKNLKPAIGTVI
jgi:hypothetical protein